MTDSSAGQWAPGSFRDPSGRVWLEEGRVFRLLGIAGARDWEDFCAVPRAVAAVRDLIVPVSRLSPDQMPPGVAHAAADLALEQETVPFISYPFEWPFWLLRRAALLHLELMEQLLPHGFELKDATPWNVQFHRGEPRFIDVTSIIRRQPGGVWRAYGQFCTTMLYPLMMAAWRGVSHQAVLLRNRNGWPPEQVHKVLGWSSLLKPGFFRHVLTPSHLSRNGRTDNRSMMASASTMPVSIVAGLVASLQSVVHSLDLPQDSRWASYTETCSYNTATEAEKKHVVADWISHANPSRLVDLGTNTGDYARIAARMAQVVVAVDSDAPSVDRLARSLESRSPIVPLTMDVAAMTAAGGWRGREISGFAERMRPDMVLALALVHHLCIVDRLPIADVVSALLELSPRVVLEWVDPADSMVQALTNRMGDRPSDFSEAVLRQAIDAIGSIKAEAVITPTRRLLLLERRI